MGDGSPFPRTRTRPTTIFSSSSTNRFRGMPPSYPRTRRPRGRCSWRRRFRPIRRRLTRKWCRWNNWPASPGRRRRVIWQAPLPQDTAAKLVKAFVNRGGQVLFLPPAAPTDVGTKNLPPRTAGGAAVPAANSAGETPAPREFFGVRWGAWTSGDEETAVETWRGDQDLLVHTLSGQSLPVGDLKVRRHCGVSGEVTTLAALRGGAAVRAGCHGAWRRLLPDDYAGSGRLLAGGRRRRPLRRRAAGDGHGRRGPGQHARPGRRRGTQGHPRAAEGPGRLGTSRNRGNAWQAARTLFPPSTRSSPEFTRRATGCWPSTAPPRRTRPPC